MAFNLKRVLKALLISSNQPLAIKEIQEAFARFHEQAARPAAPALAAAGGAQNGAVADPASAAAPDPAAAADPADPADRMEGPAETELGVEQDPELYSEVPSLVTASQIRETMEEIASDLRATGDGLVLVDGPSGYRLATDPSLARWVRILRQEPPPVKLSQSALETLAVVSYRQPVTRAEIESIRGVAAEAGIHKLIERELITIVGRAELPGRPLQYGTTDQFLDFVGIKSLDELPASDVLTSRQIDTWLVSAGRGRPMGDSEMGLDDEQLPLSAADSSEEPAPDPEAIPPDISPEEKVSEVQPP